MGIVDTHLHLIDRAGLSYPWLTGFDALPGNYLYDTYAREAQRCGITDCLHMEVDVAENDIERETAYVEALSHKAGVMIRGAISSCRPENPDFPAFLERQLANPFIRGFRRVLHVVPDDVSTTATFRDNVRRLSGTGKVFDLVVLPHQIAIVTELVDHCPDVQFVLDHCGVPSIKDKLFDPWKAGITGIAKRPNVAVKLSGIVAYSDPVSWTVDDLKPYAEFVFAAFGTDRIVWGSDWPVVTLGGTLSNWVAATHALLASYSRDERDAILSGNARRLWSLPA